MLASCEVSQDDVCATYRNLGQTNDSFGLSFVLTLLILYLRLLNLPYKINSNFNFGIQMNIWCETKERV